MPKFTVTLEEIVTYDIIVDSADEEEAKADAEAAFVNAEDLGQFNPQYHKRDVTNVERMSDEMAESIAD